MEARLEDVGDAGVLEQPERLGLVSEAGERLQARDARSQDLQRTRPLRAGLLGEVDDPEAALAQDADQPVRADAAGARLGRAFGACGPGVGQGRLGVDIRIGVDIRGFFGGSSMRCRSSAISAGLSPACRVRHAGSRNGPEIAG